MPVNPLSAHSPSGPFELPADLAGRAPPGTPRSYVPPQPQKPDAAANAWFNRQDYLPPTIPQVTATYRPTEKSQRTRDYSWGECVLSNGVVVPARGSVMLDTRTVYSLRAQRGSEACSLVPSLRVHVIEPPPAKVSWNAAMQPAAYRPGEGHQAKFYKVAAAPVVVAGAYATAFMAVTGLYYLNQFLGQDVADPARELANPLPNAVVLHPAVTAGIDAQRRNLGLASGEAVDIFLSPQAQLLGPLKLFTLLGISPNTPARPSEEFCRQVRMDCRVACGDKLGRRDLEGRTNQGAPFFNCVRECTIASGCDP